MWHIIFLAVFPCIISAGIKPLEPLDAGPLWRERIAEALLPDEDYSSDNFENLRQRYPYRDIENTEPDFSMYPRQSAGKRALSMFARWGSINSIGKNRPPIRSNLLDSDEQLNTNNRRMQGQPLRWG